MKKVLAIWGSQNVGKSSTVLQLAFEMMNAYPTHKVIFSSKPITSLSIDFRLILEINNRIIAFESMGDPNSGLNIRLPEIINDYNPDVLICTCRTRGYTVFDVENAAKVMGTDIIWSSPYQSTANYSVLNNLKAKHLLNLLVSLHLI